MPVLARIYNIPPRDQAALTLGEFQAIKRDYRALLETEKGGGEWQGH